MSESIGRSALKEQLQSMDDYEFEHFVADLWERQGWTTEVEQQSSDAGVDVRAVQTTPYQRKHLIQAKRYSDTTTVGGPDVQQYASLKQQEPGVDAAVIVTTSTFTNAGKQRANDLNVKTVDGDDLVTLIKETGSYNLVDEYLNIRAEPQVTPELSEVTTTDDQIEILSWVPLLEFTYRKGFTPEDADITATWRYYAIWVGIGAWLTAFIVESSELAGLLPTFGWLFTPIAIALDARAVGALTFRDRMWQIGVLGSFIPAFGVAATGLYLIHRRAMKLDQRN